ncbi:hypothetical protein HDU97_003392 [Phlyctochytrium planicorne]|nr:hypothetical protein HDU97_003392 [Phlyctochytrium planicorne]
MLVIVEWNNQCARNDNPHLVECLASTVRDTEEMATKMEDSFGNCMLDIEDEFERPPLPCICSKCRPALYSTGSKAVLVPVIACMSLFCLLPFFSTAPGWTGESFRLDKKIVLACIITFFFENAYTGVYLQSMRLPSLFLMRAISIRHYVSLYWIKSSYDVVRSKLSKPVSIDELRGLASSDIFGGFDDYQNLKKFAKIIFEAIVKLDNGNKLYVGTFSVLVYSTLVVSGCIPIWLLLFLCYIICNLLVICFAAADLNDDMHTVTKFCLHYEAKFCRLLTTDIVQVPLRGEEHPPSTLSKVEFEMTRYNLVMSCLRRVRALRSGSPSVAVIYSSELRGTFKGFTAACVLLGITIFVQTFYRGPEMFAIGVVCKQRS